MVEHSQSPSTEQQKPVGWREFNRWYDGLSKKDRIKGMASGQWPEGTPQLFVDLVTRTTVEERTLVSIFGEKSTHI